MSDLKGGAGTIIVVLGDRPDGDTPTEEMLKRVRLGVRLVAEEDASLIIYSGGRTSGRHSEGFLMQQIAEDEFPDLAMPAVIEPKSLDTIGNAYFTARVLENVNFERMFVVTSPSHATRAGFIFNSVFEGRAEVRTFGQVPDRPSVNEEEAMELAHLILDGIEPMDLDAVWRRMKDMHPYYMSDNTE